MTLCDIKRNCLGEVFISIDGNLVEIVPAGHLGISRDERIDLICDCHRQ
jgi:hypothetical protein